MFVQPVLCYYNTSLWVDYAMWGLSSLFIRQEWNKSCNVAKTDPQFKKKNECILYIFDYLNAFYKNINASKFLLHEKILKVYLA